MPKDKVMLTEQQDAAVKNRGGNLLVSAAAGTGKTKVLVERIMDRICGDEQKNITDFLVITYTKAAAAELRAKITAELSARMVDEPGNEHLRRQMHLVYGARISTVHSFCADLLRTHAAEAGISADFRVGEEQEMRVIRAAVMEDLLEGIYKTIERRPNVKAFVDELGMGRDDSAVAAILYSIYDTIQSHPWPEKWAAECLQAMDISAESDAGETPWGAYLMQRAKRLLETQLPIIADVVRMCKTNDKLAECYLPTIAEDEAKITALLRAKSWDQMVLLKADPWMRMKTIRKGVDVPESTRERILAIRNRYKKDIDESMKPMYGMSEEVLGDLRMTEASVNGMMELVADFANRYTAKKEMYNILDFSDLEHISLRVLLDPESGKKTATAESVSAAFAEIMVDEYQDTNGVQEAIFNAISTGSNLFMVGDVKQSIYRFRLAEPEIFLNHYLAYTDAADAKEGEARKIRLTTNFRSRPEILDAANTVMRTCMSEDVGGVSYTEEEALVPGKAPTTELAEPVVELTMINMDDARGDGEDDVLASVAKADIEAEYVANRIQDMLEFSEIEDDETGEFRPVKASDIAILMYAPRHPAAHYTKALAVRGIAAKAARNGSIMETTEIATLFCYLQIIDNPTQDIPLVSVLASPLCGFTANDLADVRTSKRDAKSFYEAMHVYAESNDKGKRFMATLNTLRDYAAHEKLSRLFTRLLEMTDADDVFGAMSNGDQRVANIRKFSEMIASYEAGGARGLFHFICHMESLIEQGAELPQATCMTNTDAVTIMSVHAAKGLEYPIVFLADLSRRFNMSDLKDTALLDKDLGAGVQVVVTKPDLPVHRYPTIARSAIAAKTAEESKSEALRVLYVAMTRAKQKLVMTYCDKLDAQLAKLAENAAPVLAPQLAQTVTNPGQWVLYAALGNASAPWKTHNIDSRRIITKTMTMAEIDAGGELAMDMSDADELPDTEMFPALDTDRIEKDMAFCYAYAAATTAASKTVATAMTEMEVPIVVTRPSFVRAERKATAAEQGTATHAFLQHADYRTCREKGMVGIREEIERLAGNGFIAPESKSAVMKTALNRLFQSEVGRRLAETNGIHREYEFTVLMPASAVYKDCEATDDVVVQGAIDLHYIAEDGIHILDFKTDNVKTTVEMAEKAEAYRPQLGVYASALESIYKRPVVEKSIIFVRKGRAVRVA